MRMGSAHRRLWIVRRPRRVRLSSGLVLVAALLGAPLLRAGEDAVPPNASAEAPLEVILARAGAYVERYGESFRNLVAEEAYEQSAWPANVLFSLGGESRNLRSDVVFVRLPGPIPWCTFRDVYKVNGAKVRDREGRLERLFAQAPESAPEQARTILKESSRYNLGSDRTVHSPTIALLFLLPKNQPRLLFRRAGQRTVAGFPATEVAFVELTRPTLVRDLAADRDTPASGSVWIDPSRGTVLRTRIVYDIKPEEVRAGGDRWRAEVSTEYRRESGLDIFVPEAMKEFYASPMLGRVECRARYSHYRRFQVTSEWEVARDGGEAGTPETLPAP